MFSLAFNLRWMRMGKNVRLALHWDFFLCHLKTCNDGSNINKHMKLELIFIHSFIRISTASVFYTCFVYAVVIRSKVHEAFYISYERRELTQLKVDI